ncbi:MAG: GH1 family beta-glucosidase [Acidimicrobiia bacterium]|nr:GH1 family beta-glucosidase [Acidimicrobiia bacterium]
MTLNATDFPEDFVWGVATSAPQIEGAVDEDGRSPSIWDTFAHTPGKIDRGENADTAADHYHRFEEDVDLMAELGINAYRFSISWSRLLPEGVGEVNEAGADFYRRLCSALLAKGITPVVTLYHWDLPQVLHDRGGWLNRESVDWFVEYAVAAKEALGDLVRVWTTFNEPHCTAFLGYASGLHAPGVTDPGSAYIVSHHLMLAHHKAVKAMRTTNPHEDDQFSIVLNLIPAWAAEPSAESKEVAAGVDAIHNRLYASAVLDGRYPSVILDYMAKFDVVDRIDLEELEACVEPIDFLGMNYYNVNHIGHAPGAPLLPDWPGPENAELMRPPGHLTEMHWGVEPVGLTWMLNRVSRWAPDLPIYLMENGAAYPDEPDADGVVHDALRQEYIEAHLAAVRQAMDDGADVRGYFVWSLLDNFEWAYGYDKRFGLVRVDFDTLERTMKDSGRWYRQFLAS